MSIASAPSDDDLVLLMRVRDSAFKRSIMNLASGASLLLDGPADDLTFDVCSAAPTVLIAGGVGIAPGLDRLAVRADDDADGRCDARVDGRNGVACARR